MEFLILGPLEARVDGRALALGGAKQRVLLALLLLHRNEVVSTDRLIDGLWGEAPPATAVKVVQVYVSRLRRLLVAVGAGPGTAGSRDRRATLLELGADELDLDRFEAAGRAGGPSHGRPATRPPPRRRSAAGSPCGADRRWPTWRSSPSPRRRPRASRSSGWRRSRAAIAADLALGRAPELIGELGALVGEHPLRERLRGSLVLALYRAGRQVEALEAYREARRALVHDLGIEPSPELAELERAILRHDPALALPSAARPRPPQPPSAAPRAAARRRGRRRPGGPRRASAST